MTNSSGNGTGTPQTRLCLSREGGNQEAGRPGFSLETVLVLVPVNSVAPHADPSSPRRELVEGRFWVPHCNTMAIMQRSPEVGTSR